RFARAGPLPRSPRAWVGARGNRRRPLANAVGEEDRVAGAVLRPGHAGPGALGERTLRRAARRRARPVVSTARGIRRAGRRAAGWGRRRRATWWGRRRATRGGRRRDRADPALPRLARSRRRPLR